MLRFLLAISFVMAWVGPAAAKPTIGVEWEVDDTGVMGARLVEPGKLHPKDLRFVSPEAVMCTNTKSPVKNSVPLVSFTYDMCAHYYDCTLEIVTGPIGLDGVEWATVFQVIKAYYDAVNSECTKTAVQKPDYDTYDVCFASADQVAAKMNALLGNAEMTRSCGGKAYGTAGGTAGFYLGFQDNGAPHSISTVRFATANTQVNIGIKLATFGTTSLAPLFADKGADGVAYRAWQKAFAAVKSSSWPYVDDAVRGFFVIYLYAMNAAAYGHAKKYDEVGRKNAYDLYPKTPLGQIYAAVYPQLTGMTNDPRISGSDAAIDVLGTKFCVLGPKACEAELREWNAKLVDGRDAPIATANPVGVKKTIDLTHDQRVVVEARIGTFKLNQAALMSWNATKNALEFRDRTLLDAMLGSLP